MIADNCLLCKAGMTKQKAPVANHFAAGASFKYSLESYFSSTILRASVNVPDVIL